MPGVGIDVYQPGSPTPPIAPDECIGETVKAIGPLDPRSDQQFEVTLVKFDKSRLFEQDPHAPGYPFEPSLGAWLQIQSSANLIIEGQVTNHGWGQYGDYGFWVDIMMGSTTVRMYDQMIVLPPNVGDNLWVAYGASGGVFYEPGGIPVSIMVGHGDLHDPSGNYIATLAIASFLNRENGPDILDILDVTNTGPPGIRPPPDW